MSITTLRRLCATLLTVSLLAGCSPTFDWRDFHAGEAGYSAQFPAKPLTHSRSVELDGRSANMAMAATEIDGVTFAIGSAELADAAQATLALVAMKTALLRNIDGKITADHLAAAMPGAASGQTVLEVVASGTFHERPMELQGRFVARGKRIYQIIVVGGSGHVNREAAETFLSSFRLD